MVREHPDDCRGHHVLALASAASTTGQGHREIRQVMALAPGYDPAWESFASLLNMPGNPDADHRPDPAGARSGSIQPRTTDGAGLRPDVQRSRDRGIDATSLRLPVGSQSADTLAELAWKLATDPEPTARNGPVAVKLAEQACAVAGPRQTTCILVLAAAYAEAAQVSGGGQNRRTSARFSPGLGRFHRRGAGAAVDRTV